jgi:alcohol dehydrogenase class IV
MHHFPCAPLPSRLLGAFDHQPRTRLIFGAGSLARVGEMAREICGRRTLLVTDKGIVAAGHAARAVQSIEAAGLHVEVYDEVRENPTTLDVARCLEVAQRANIDLIIGLGGGSSMDNAKGCNFLLTNGGEMKDYQGVGKATKPMLPLIAIPTTAGTGSECQSFALISNEKTHQKMACGDPKAAARVSILDPELTLSQPPRVAACTGIDAVAHAVETAVTKKRSALSWFYSREAFRLTAMNLPLVRSEPDNLEARAAMQLGAAFSGTAIENSMLGAAHSAANPLTAHFGIIHGQAVGLMLPHVVQFNGEEPQTRKTYAELAESAGLAQWNGSTDRAFDALVVRLVSLLAAMDMPTTLSACGVPESAIPMLAREAAQQWTAQFNPREISAADFEKLYEAAL